LVDQDECDGRAMGSPGIEIGYAEIDCEDEDEDEKREQKRQKKKAPKTHDLAKIKKLLIKMGVYNSSESESEAEDRNLNSEMRYVSRLIVYLLF
jgi:hypothetical protein